MASSQVSAAISAFIYFFFFSLWEVECVVAVKNCIMEHLGRIWAIADFLAPPLGNWDVTRECYTKYSSNYWQLMIVVTGKAVCVRNQLPTGCLVLLNPPWPPPALPSFWKFVRPCLAFAPRGRGGSLHEVHSCKVWIGFAEVCNQDQAWNQQKPSSVIKWSGCGLRDGICMSLLNLL